MRFNKKYAEKLEEKAARKKDQERLEKPAQSTGQKSNPFSVSSYSDSNYKLLTSRFQFGDSAEVPSSFGLGSQIFGGSTEEVEPIPPEPEFEDDDSDSDIQDDSEDSMDSVDEEAEELADALAKTSLNDVNAVWKEMPAHPPLYLSTISEYLPPVSKAKANIKVDDGLGDCKTKGRPESYENSLNVDEVFSRFIKRVECEGEQCIRWVDREVIRDTVDQLSLLRQVRARRQPSALPGR